jgi:hypothetical protein
VGRAGRDSPNNLSSQVLGKGFKTLRRTARSLMSRAGVSSDCRRIMLGPGIRATYDRHSYLDEKRAAFEKLARIVGKITG